MEITGIVKRIDDLGRIVIPKEIRKTVFGESDVEGYEMEIFVEKDGTIILKPYRPVNIWKPIANPHDKTIEFVCSCEYVSESASNYCPDCGTKMDNTSLYERIKKAKKLIKMN